MDCYQNYSDKQLEYDIFVAISHGQYKKFLKKVNLTKEKIYK